MQSFVGLQTEKRWGDPNLKEKEILRILVMYIIYVIYV